MTVLLRGHLNRAPLKCFTRDLQCHLLNDLIFSIIAVLCPVAFILIFGLMTIVNLHQTRGRIEPLILTTIYKPVARNSIHDHRQKRLKKNPSRSTSDGLRSSDLSRPIYTSTPYSPTACRIDHAYSQITIASNDWGIHLSNSAYLYLSCHWCALRYQHSQWWKCFSQSHVFIERDDRSKIALPMIHVAFEHGKRSSRKSTDVDQWIDVDRDLEDWRGIRSRYLLMVDRWRASSDEYRMWVDEVLRAIDSIRCRASSLLILHSTTTTTISIIHYNPPPPNWFILSILRSYMMSIGSKVLSDYWTNIDWSDV